MYNESPSPKGALVGCEAKRESDIPSALHELEKAIAILQDELSILYGRLHPVMRNESQGNEEKMPEQQDRCEISGIIRNNARSVHRVTKDVRTVLGLLEI